MRLITVALILSGALNAQTTCSNPLANQVLLRSEGLTEQVGDFTFTCSGPGGLATIRAALSPSLPITSAVLSAPSATTLYTDALAISASGSAQGVVDASGT